MKTEYIEKGGFLQRDGVEHKEYAEAYSAETQKAEERDGADLLEKVLDRDKQIYIKDRIGRYQFNFLSFVSKKSAKNFRDKIKAMELHKMTGRKIEMIAELMNPMVRGWLNYFSAYCKSAVKYTMDCLNRRIVKWAMSKYKRFKGHRNRAELWLKNTCKKRTQHVCTLGSRMDSIMANMKSRVKREFHARFCESLLVKFLWATRLRGERKSPLLD